MTKSKVKSWLDIIIQDYIYEDVEDELIEMRDIIYNALDTQALKQQPSEDCINRKEAIKEFQVYREYSSNLTNNEWVDRIETVLVSLPSVNPVPNISIQITERENMEDLISRQAVLEKAIIVPIAKVVTEDKVICRKIVFVEDIQKLPSVTPKGVTITDFADKCRECGKNAISREKIKEALEKMERGLQSCFNTIHCESNHDLLEGQERAFKYCIETLKEVLDERKTES